MKIFAGNANLALAYEVTAALGFNLSKAKLGRFSDGELLVEIQEDVRGEQIFIIQPTSAPVNDHLFELLLMADAMRRASAATITAVIPYFGYARQDRRPNALNVPITAKVIADIITAVGIDRMLTIDLHSEQIQGFFQIPIDNIYGSTAMLADIRQQNFNDLVIVSPDIGGVARARTIAKQLDNAELAIIDKRRQKHNQVEIMHVIGDIDGRTCVIIDDIIDTANTVSQAAQVLKLHGARKVVVYATHAVLSGNAVTTIQNSVIDQVVVTNTIQLTAVALDCPKIRQLTIGPLLAETIKSLQNNSSINCLTNFPT